jgi:integrase
MYDKVINETTRNRWVFFADPFSPDDHNFLDWLKFLPLGAGTKHQRTYLLTSAKQFMRARIDTAATRNKKLSYMTVNTWYGELRILVHWMLGKNIFLFSRIAANDLINFLNFRLNTQWSDHNRLVYESRRIDFLQLLWDLRHDYIGALRINPASLKLKKSLGRRPQYPTRWLSLEESVALPLIRDAIQWNRLYGEYTANLLQRIYNLGRHGVGLTAKRKKQNFSAFYKNLDREPEFVALRHALGLEKRRPHFVVHLIFSHMEGACLLVLFFLIGLRRSELISLNTDAVRLDALGDGQKIYRIKGVAAKKGGLSRTWVASPEIVEVISYLIRFYAPVREETGQKALFLGRPRWAARGLALGHRLSAVSISRKLRAFADAPHRRGSPEVTRLHPHVARKTFARFVVLRDKRALESLSHHFGHTHRMITDGHYVGSDMELAKLINEEGRRDLANGLTDILASDAIAGRASGALKAYTLKKSADSFRGRYDLQSLVDRLIEQGIQLAPCDWGYCVYAQSLSACRGDSIGPNEANRSPEVCANCANFVVTDKHRLWWSERFERDAEFVDLPGVSRQSKDWVRKRLASTEKILFQLNSRDKDEEAHVSKGGCE